MPDIDNELIGAKTKAVPVKPKEFGMDTTQNLTTEIIDAADTSQLDISVLESFSTVAQTREEVYQLIDTMAQDDKVSSILETYVEDVVETNDNGQIVWCESSDEKCAKYVNYLLDALNVDKNIYGWAFKLTKYGDLYLKFYRESDYGTDLLFGDNKEDAYDGKKKTLKEEIDSKAPLKEEVLVKVSGKDDHYVHYVEAVDNPGEMFELTKYGKTMGYIKAPVRIQKNYNKNDVLNSYLTYKMKKSDVTVYGATDFVHACLEDDTVRNPEEVNIFLSDEDIKNEKIASSYKVRKGQSLLYNTFKVWRELTLLENSVLLNRITKSSIVRILNVDTGDMPKEQVNNFVQRLKATIEQKCAVNVGDSMTDYTNPGPMENIIYIPTHGGQGQITATNLGGDVDPKQLTDLDWFNNRFYGAYRIPKAYFGWTDDGAGFNGGQSLSIISARYGKAVKRIQNTLCQAITDVINVLLWDKGLISYINKFQIRMQTPLTQEELDRRENMRNRVGVIGDIMNQVSGVVDDNLIKVKIAKELLSTATSNSEVISLLQEYIDSLEEKPEGEEGNNEEGGESPVETAKPLSPRQESPFESNPLPNTEETPPVEEPTSIGGEEGIEEIGGEESYLPSPSELNLDMTGNLEI